MATQPQKNSVLIYESFWLAICDLDVTVQARMFKAIMEYGMYGVQPQLSGIEKSLFVLMKPQIDANITRYNNRKSKIDSQSEEPANVTTKKDKTEPTRTRRNKRATNVNANANDNVNDNVNVNVNDNVNANVNESVYVYDDNDRDARTHSACEQSEMQCAQTEKQCKQSAHSEQSQQFADISCGAHTLNEKQMGKSCMQSTSQSTHLGTQNTQLGMQNAQNGAQSAYLEKQNMQIGVQSAHLDTQNAHLERQGTHNETKNAQSAKAGKRSFAYARTQFVKPTLEEVQSYCISRQNGINAQRFWDYYEARGWLAGNTPIHDWQATVRSWETNTLSCAPQVLSRSFAPYAPNASYAPKKAIVGAEIERRPYTDEDLSHLFTPLDDVA